MKRIIITMLVALIALVNIEARPIKKAVPVKETTTEAVEKANEQKTDEQAALTEAANEQNAEETNDEDASSTKKMKFDTDGVFVKDKDGKTVKVKFGDLSRIVRDHLDDTLFSEDGFSINADGEDLNNMEVDSATYNIAQDGMDLARDISTAFFISIVWIVGLSLLFYYLHRRRKYKTVDRAIQAGYPLPDEFFGKRSQPMPQQPTTVYVTQVPPIQQPADGAQPIDGTQPATMPNYRQNSNPLNNITDWTPFKSGLRTTAVGLGLLFFFWILGVTPLAALMVIVIFIGLGKLFIAYQEQQSMKNYWQQQQWTQQPQQWTQQPQQEQPQWQQWNPQQKDIPSMPETPPEFNSMNE